MYSNMAAHSESFRHVNQQVATTVETQRNNILSRLNRTWFETVEELKAAEKLGDALRAERSSSPLSDAGSPKAEASESDEEEVFFREAADATFETETTRRVAKGVKCHISQPGLRDTNQNPHIELDLSSVFAGSKDPKEYLSDIGQALVYPRLLSAVSDATINKPATPRAFALEKEVVDSIVKSQIMPAAKTPKDGGASDYDNYVLEFRKLSPDDAESFYDQVMGTTPLPSALSFLDSDAENTYNPPENHHHGKFIAERISGVPTASVTVDGRLLPSHIDAAALKATQSRHEHERQYTASTGKQLSDLPDPADFSYISSYQRFTPSQILNERLDRTLLANAKKLEPTPLEELDLTDAFEKQSDEMYGGLFGGMGSDMMSGLMDSSIENGAAEEVDLRGFKLSLVQDSREGAATTLSGFWPKTMSEVSKY
ncbi:hypothetical protein IAT38_008418 [Cryptococcus sp. DSM 104549]